jgi:hypothetical protein
MNKLKAFLIRLISKIFDRKNPQPSASSESIAIVSNVTKELGVLAAEILVRLIYQYPDRSYYKLWFFPVHDDIIRDYQLTSQAYYEQLAKLQSSNLLKKQKDKKTKKLMYAINFERLALYQKGIPKKRVMVAV